MINSGKEEYTRVAKSMNYNVKLDDKMINEHLSKLNVHTLDDFYCEIAKNSISAKSAINKFLGLSEKLTEEDLIKHYNNRVLTGVHKPSNDFGVYIEGLDKAQVKLANCCHPVYGDNIVGYVSKGNGIIVHRYECHNNADSSHERYIDVYWDDSIKGKKYETGLSVLAFNRQNIVANIIDVFNSNNNVAIKSINSSHTKSGELLTKVKLSVDNVDTLNNLIKNLQKIPDVYQVERIFK